MKTTTNYSNETLSRKDVQSFSNGVQVTNGEFLLELENSVAELTEVIKTSFDEKEALRCYGHRQLISAQLNNFRLKLDIREIMLKQMSVRTNVEFNKLEKQITKIRKQINY